MATKQAYEEPLQARSADEADEAQGEDVPGEDEVPSLAYLLACEESPPSAGPESKRTREKRAALHCEQIMKRDVHAVAEVDDAFAAARIMREHDVGFLPVCDPNGTVVGVLTDRDLAIRLCAEDGRASTTSVGALMTRGAVTCRRTDSVAHVQHLMAAHRLTRILVVDGSGRPLGVVSLSDIAQYERPARVGRTVQAVTERKYAPERP